VEEESHYDAYDGQQMEQRAQWNGAPQQFTYGASRFGRPMQPRSTSGGSSRWSSEEPDSPGDQRITEDSTDPPRGITGDSSNAEDSPGPLRKATVPSDEALAAMRTNGPSDWVVVKHCGWNGNHTETGEQPDLYRSLLHEAGTTFAQDSFTYYVRLPPGAPVDTFRNLLQRMAFEMASQRPARDENEAPRAYRRYRPRLTTNFPLIALP
jgi:hypothetical protein